MKGSCTLAASMLAASTVALSSSSSSSNHPHDVVSHLSSQQVTDCKKGSTPKGKEKFAPRFDGLRFIETLVTAHR